MFQLNLREKISSQSCFFLKLLLTAGRIKHYQLINDMSYKATKETKNQKPMLQLLQKEYYKA